MTRHVFLARSAAAGLVLLSASGAAQSANAPADRPAAAIPKGICEEPGIRLLGDADLDDQGRIPPGRYLISSTPEMSFDIELVGAGGSGGGTTLGNRLWFWGSGGGHGEVKRWPGYKLGNGAYLLEVGRGGAAVSGSRNWRDFRQHVVNGQQGNGTVIKRCASGFTIIGAQGGGGGKGDNIDVSAMRAQRAGSGEGLADPETGAMIGSGGAGGIWQASGESGTGRGAGGGGEGGHNGNGSQSGAGVDGYARVVPIE